MTVSFCSHLCSVDNYTIFGLQYGSYCYCGTPDSQYERFGGVLDYHCNTPCDGAPSCGHNDLITFYKINGFNYTYSGCFFYTTNGNFYFGGLVPNLDLEVCVQRCHISYEYAALTQGNKCYCSDRLPQKSLKESDSECLTKGLKCRGGEKCGGSGAIAIWTSLTNLENTGTTYAGCFNEVIDFNFKGNRNFTDCKQHCKKNYPYFGMSSETQCYCVQYLPHINVKNIKTSKLLYSPGNQTFYLRILCNTSETGFIAVWEYTKENLNDISYPNKSKSFHENETNDAKTDEDVSKEGKYKLPVSFIPITILATACMLSCIVGFLLRAFLCRITVSPNGQQPQTRGTSTELVIEIFKRSSEGDDESRPETPKIKSYSKRIYKSFRRSRSFSNASITYDVRNSGFTKIQMGSFKPETKQKSRGSKPSLSYAVVQ
ncbi:hypothetical protein HOLleu_23306 [Holothuria leucospilota]|uniref:WSC domain-containing protein n=1 Tax=Holothuria leucospilota TaxID=206669 RepID=A0A9Q1BV03_HOLLE|nr:hypothetical protein HOLleu_23306 [Holothuria leucospilota]